MSSPSMVIVHQIYKKPSITQRSEFHIISPWRNQTNPLMKGITSCCQEEAVIISGVATIPLPGRSKTPPGLPQVRPAGRGHARFCNLLIIKYHFYCSVETMAFFGCVSTLRFITHWQSTPLKTERGRVPPHRAASPRTSETLTHWPADPKTPPQKSDHSKRILTDGHSRRIG